MPAPQPIFKRLAARASIVLAVLNLVYIRGTVPPVSWSPHLESSRNPDPTKEATVNTHCQNVSIIITSSFVPSHPSLEVIRRTIESLDYLEGLDLNNTPILITVDGAEFRAKGMSAGSRKKSMILSQYIQNLRQAYGERKNIQILEQPHRINLVGNMRWAIKNVDTAFVYVIQHDMPFVSPIDHSALLLTLEQDETKDIRLVRFSPRTTLARNRDKLGLCGTTIDVEANGIALAKTHTWSDNNHFTRKSYYEEMFTTMDGWDDVRYMETIMNPIATKNCSYWGTYLYGKQGQGPPTIVHLDARNVVLDEDGSNLP